MEITRASLQNLYQQTETDELLKLHSQGTLTDLAYHELETELIRRGMIPPPHPIVSDENQQSTHSYDYWSGKKPLFTAWVMLGVIGHFMVIIFLVGVAGILSGFELFRGKPFISFIPLPYFVFAWVSIWRCANNTHSKFLFIIARFYVVMWALQWILIWAWAIKSIIYGKYY